MADTVRTFLESDIIINALLFDAGKYAEKVAEKGKEDADKHIFFIGGTGARAKAKIENDLNYCLAEIMETVEEHLVMDKVGFNRDPDAPPNTYCMADDNRIMISAFTVNYVTFKVLSDEKLFSKVQTFFKDTVEAWLRAHNIYKETKENKPGEYIYKILGAYPTEQAG